MDSQEPRLVRNWLPVKMGWAHPHLPNGLRVPLNNNKNVTSLTINKWEFVPDGHRVPTATPMVDLKSLKIHCPTEDRLEKHSRPHPCPTVQGRRHHPVILSLTQLRSGSHRWLRSHVPTLSIHDLRFYLLQHLGAIIITLRLDPPIGHFNEPVYYELFWSLDAVEVL